MAGGHRATVQLVRHRRYRARRLGGEAFPPVRPAEPGTDLDAVLAARVRAAHPDRTLARQVDGVHVVVPEARPGLRDQDEPSAQMSGCG